uniref:Uncharacterized protein n=1 Tax=Avena sativa TaxID=4498 RepID=A0ACD6ANM5_AVESA
MMNEIQPAQPMAIPSWVMLDQRFLYKDPISFRADGETSAETHDTNGQPVRVSFDIQSPPGSSRLCLHSPAERESSFLDFVVAAHRDAVLFRIEVDYDGRPFDRRGMDYFIYRAHSSSSGPKLTLLPRCYSTSDEIFEAAHDDASWRGKRFMVTSTNIGLLAAAEGAEQKFVVAELCIRSAADKTAPLEAELFRLISSSSSPAASANGGDQWELTRARSHDGKVRFQDMVSWESHRVVPFTSSYLCWADYNKGVLFCDVSSKNPHLEYLPLPVDDMPREDFPMFSRALCLTNKGRTIKFVTVSKTPSCPNCNPGLGFTISVHTMEWTNHHAKRWVVDVKITEKTLWAMKGYDLDQLPCSVPQHPLVSMDDPHILYFVLTGTSALSDETVWIVTLDIARKTILSCDGIKAFPSDNFLNGFGFFPSDFTNYTS